jgi:hypothetical protein
MSCKLPNSAPSGGTGLVVLGSDHAFVVIVLVAHQPWPESCETRQNRLQTAIARASDAHTAAEHTGGPSRGPHTSTPRPHLWLRRESLRTRHPHGLSPAPPPPSVKPRAVKLVYGSQQPGRTRHGQPGSSVQQTRSRPASLRSCELAVLGPQERAGRGRGGSQEEEQEARALTNARWYGTGLRKLIARKTHCATAFFVV